MKNLKILLLAVIAITSFNSCSDDDDFTFTAQEDPEGIMFINSFSESYLLTPSNNEGMVERFVWNEVNFDVQTTVRYELQGSTNESFDDYSVLGTDISVTNYAVNMGSIIDLAEEAGLDNDPETEAPNTGVIYVRLRAYVGENSVNNVEQFSEPVALNVELSETSGEEEPALPNFFLVGDATAAGWDVDNNNTPLFRDPENSNIFYFEGRFAGGEGVEGFKLIEMLGEWQPQWGISDGSLTSSTILGADPDAFPVDADAYYSLMVNTEDMTYTFEEIDASSAETYSTIGLIGNSTPGGWDADTDMTQSVFNPHIWYVNGIELGDGEYKFRADDAWDVNWGTATDALSGTASLGSPDNMNIAAGTYNVWFNDLTGRFILIPSED